MAQKTETDFRELTDLIKGLGTKIGDLDKRFVESDKKIEGLDKKMDLGFQALDKKMDLAFAESDKKIEALDKKMDLGFQALDKKMDLGFQEIDSKIDLGFQQTDSKIDKLDLRLGILNTTVTTLDNRLWTFIGITLSVTLGSLLTVFVRYIFSDNPKF